MIDFKNKKILITGATGGIGYSLVEKFNLLGGSILATGTNEDKLEDLKKKYSKIKTIKFDISKHDEIENMIDKATSELDGLDILINNAALFTAAPITDIDRDDYLNVFSVNVSGVLFTMQAVARHMIGRGNGGKIINMASQAGRRGEPLVAVYCASKAAVISLTQSAGLNLIKYGINVNAIAPGVVDGVHWDGVDAAFSQLEGLPLGHKKKTVGAAVPFGRMGKPSDLIGMAVFLATSEADYIVAQTFGVDGGNWMS